MSRAGGPADGPVVGNEERKVVALSQLRLSRSRSPSSREYMFVNIRSINSKSIHFDLTRKIILQYGFSVFFYWWEGEHSFWIVHLGF